MSTTTLSLTQSDLEYLAKGLDVLSALRVEQGLEVGSFVYDDLEFTLEYTDEGGYVLGAVND